MVHNFFRSFKLFSENEIEEFVKLLKSGKSVRMRISYRKVRNAGRWHSSSPEFSVPSIFLMKEKI
jgi:hypothetical protein